MPKKLCEICPNVIRDLQHCHSIEYNPKLMSEDDPHINLFFSDKNTKKGKTDWEMKVYYETFKMQKEYYKSICDFLSEHVFEKKLDNYTIANGEIYFEQKN
jgi:hypothetical protein